MGRITGVDAVWIVRGDWSSLQMCLVVGRCGLVVFYDWATGSCRHADHLNKYRRRSSLRTSLLHSPGSIYLRLVFWPSQPSTFVTEQVLIQILKAWVGTLT